MAAYDTTTEQQYYAKLYTIADTDHDGKISGAEGAPFLRKSGLPDALLEKIWDMSDANRQGFLKEREFAIAMRLVALGQEGKTVTLNQVPNVSSYPKFEGVPQPPPSFPTRISDEDLFKFDNLFVQADQDQDGYVNGQEARAYFTKAKIPTDKLAAIWELAEHDGDGKLNRGEFRVAMTLMYWLLRGNDLPQAVPTAFVTYAGSAPSTVPGPTPAPVPAKTTTQPPPTQLTTQAPIQPLPASSSNPHPTPQGGIGYTQAHPNVAFTQGQVPISQVPQGQVTVSQGMPMAHQPMPITYVQPVVQPVMQPGMQPGMMPSGVQPGMMPMGFVQGGQVAYVAPVTGGYPMGYVVPGPTMGMNQMQPNPQGQPTQHMQMPQQMGQQMAHPQMGQQMHPQMTQQQMGQQMHPQMAQQQMTQQQMAQQPNAQRPTTQGLPPPSQQPIAQLPSGYPQLFTPAPAQNTFTETSANTIHKYTLPGATFEQRANLSSELNNAINRRKPSQ